MSSVQLPFFSTWNGVARPSLFHRRPPPGRFIHRLHSGPGDASKSYTWATHRGQRRVHRQHSPLRLCITAASWPLVDVHTRRKSPVKTLPHRLIAITGSLAFHGQPGGCIVRITVNGPFHFPCVGSGQATDSAHSHVCSSRREREKIGPSPPTPTLFLFLFWKRKIKIFL